METKSSYDPELWQKRRIVQLGWTGIRIPEEFGGLGLGHLEACVIAEELGRSGSSALLIFRLFIYRSFVRVCI